MPDTLKKLSSTNNSKRQTLKAIGGLTAAGVLTAIPGISAATTFDALDKGQMSDFPAQLEGILVSIPNITGETLILKNLTNHDIRIDKFEANNISFDGEVVDCNDACSLAAINVPAKQDVLIRFKPQLNKHSPARDFLDLQSDLYRLPAGTRVVPLAAHMRGNFAILAKKLPAATA